MKLVIVESPAKAKTINKFLGNDYEVIASYGHIRDLPSKAGSVLPDEDFKMDYEISSKSEKHVKNITKAFKSAECIFLATDPDREGESIAWHIIEAMKEKKALKKNIIVKRVIFNEITKSAVIYGINNPKDINIDLVNAQQARRALDYLYGFTLSPILWRKLPGSKSAGRVQSAALRMICERENEIEKFISIEYWSAHINFLTESNKILNTNVTHIDGKKLDKFTWNNKELIEKATEDISKGKYHISDIEKKKISKNPSPPFITSTLQQDMARKFGFSAKYTMQLAQKLYEGIEIKGETIGLITYMRTDSVQLSKEAIDSCRDFIEKNLGKNYLPDQPKIYKTKSASAQEAHEAIRPTYINYTPDYIKSGLDNDQFKLYDLIWKRCIASQVNNAIIDQVSMIISDTKDKTRAKAVGSTVEFDGFYKLYKEGLDDTKDEEDKLLPKVSIGDDLEFKDLKLNQHFTEAPPRFSEASLIKKLEELGIGRPSTYASIISVIQDRSYVRLDKKRFYPEERGRLVTAFLVSFFKQYVEYDFTASLEEQLDQVSSGGMSWKDLLKDFWSKFYDYSVEIKNLDPLKVTEAITELLHNHFFPNDNKNCPICDDGKLSIKLGKWGVFAACSEYPECKFTRTIGDESKNESDYIIDDNILGTNDSGLNIYLKKGPYGYYLQLGEIEGKNKPKRTPVPNFMEISDIDIDKANKLLSLPKNLGINPQTIQEVTLGIGKFGPYLLHDKKYTSVIKDESFLDINLDQALDIIKENKSNSNSGLVRIIGTHPDSNDNIELHKGRYGLYMKYQKKNIPMKKIGQEDINIEQAIDIINKFIKKIN